MRVLTSSSAAVLGFVLFVGGGSARLACAQSVVVAVSGKANPWLAGMPGGSTADAGDQAPAQSPVQVPVPLQSGMVVRFASTGVTDYGGGAPSCGAEGGCGRTECHRAGSENGLSSLCAGDSALVGVFLDAGQPCSSTPCPAGPPQSDTATVRESATVMPMLRQTFFIGDGRTSGGAIQQFIAPAGATRLFLGTMDAYAWSDNGGTLMTTVSYCLGFTQQPGTAIACPTGGALYSVTAWGTGTLSYQWQIQIAPGTWQNLAATPIALPCGGVATASAMTPDAAQTTIVVRPCPASNLAVFQRFPIRCILTSDCGSLASNEVLYTICPADFNCSGAITVQDIFDFLHDWFSNLPAADVNGHDGVSLQDIFDFLAAYFTGCS